MRNLAIVLAAQGNANAGLILLDSAIARERLLGRESGTSYMTGQRVPMLVQLGRVREAVESATTANAYRARLPKGSTRGADLSFWMGMAALADGRPVDATQHWSSAAEATNSFYPSGHPKGAMMRCALGVALAKLERVTEARALLSAACATSVNWALFDPMVAEWGRREATRLGVQFAAKVSR